MATQREKLDSLEKTGNFVFHGSPHKVEFLEPRQAQNYDEKTDTMVDDGNAAVSATPFSDIAIFRAIFNSTNIPVAHTTGWTRKNGEYLFSATSESFDYAQSAVGYVYVFDKSDFEQHSPSEYRAKKVMYPKEIIPVTYEDISKNIEVDLKKYD